MCNEYVVFMQFMRNLRLHSSDVKIFVKGVSTLLSGMRQQQLARLDWFSKCENAESIRLARHLALKSLAKVSYVNQLTKSIITSASLRLLTI